MAQHYWHLFGAPVRYTDYAEAGIDIDGDEVVWAQIIMSDIPIAADEVGKDGIRLDQRQMPFNEFGYAGVLNYLGSWDHAPSDLEQQLVVPFEWQDENLLKDEAS